MNRITFTLRLFMGIVAVTLLTLQVKAEIAIDLNDPQHVRAEAFANLPLAEAQALVPTQTPLIATHGQWAFSLKFQWLDGDIHQIAQVSHAAARCPNCAETTMQWDVNNPDVMTCTNCATVLPSDYPENATLSLTTWDGGTLYPEYPPQAVDIPYYENPTDPTDRYFFNGVIQSFKNFYVYNALADAAATYKATQNAPRFAQRAADILARYTLNIQSWVPRLGDQYEPFDNTLNHTLLGDTRMPHRNWSAPFVTMRDDPAFSQIVSGGSETYRDYITEHFYRYLMKFQVALPMEYVHLGNVGLEPSTISYFYSVFGFPEAAHWLMDYFRAMYFNYPCGYDGMSIEGPSYHYLWASAMTYIRLVDGYIDPPGYIYPPNGTSFTEPLKLSDYSYVGERQRGFDYTGLTMSLPDGSKAGVHDATRTLDLSQGGWYHLEKAPDKSKSFLLPSFVQAILGDGRLDQKVQTQCHASAVRSGHTSQDSLMMQFFAFGKALIEFGGHQNYSTSTVVKNTATVDHVQMNKYRTNIKGKLVFFNDQTPGLKALRIEADTVMFYNVHKKQLNRYCRTLVQNTVDLARPYVLDIFEINGGGWHEYKIAGSLLQPQSASSNISLSANPSSTPYYQSGDESYWQRFTEAREGTIGTSSYVDFTYDSAPEAPGLRMHIAPTHAGDTLKLSRLETIYSGDQEHDRPHLLISRGNRADALTEKNDLNSTFVVVHEAYQSVAKITSVGTVELPNNCLAVQVHMADRTDTYLVSKKDTPEHMSWNGYEAHAILAVFSEETGPDKRDLWMIGGTLAHTDDQSLSAASAVLQGNLLRVDREQGGAVADALITNITLPLGHALAGQLLCVDGYNAEGERILVNSYVIDSIALDTESGQTKVYVRQDPGLTLENDGSIDEIFFPKATAAAHKVRFVNFSSSIPFIAAVTPGIEHWRHEQVIMNDGRAFDQSITPEITTVPANAEVRYTTNGQQPNETSALLADGLTFTQDTLFDLYIVNPNGVTPPQVQHERYYKRKRATQGTPVLQGLNYTHYYHAGGTGMLPDLAAPNNLALTGTLSRNSLLDITGYILAPQTGYYRFYVTGSWGVDLSIDGEHVFHQYGIEMLGQWHTEIYLEQGWHQIDVAHLVGAHRWLNVEWSGPGFEQQPIPAANFAAELTGIVKDFELTYATSGAGTIQGDASQLLFAGEDGVRVSALADAGYRFVSWSDGSTAIEHQQFNIQADNTITATFEAFPEGNALTRETWIGISGNFIADLTSSPDFPDSPTSTDTLYTFDFNDTVSYSGERIRGLIRASFTGDHIFQIASDDSSELWLGTDATESSKVKIAEVSGWTSPYQFDKSEGQISIAIPLISGHAYYIEILHKEGGGNSHCTVQWFMPGASEATTISSSAMTDDPAIILPLPTTYPNYTVDYLCNAAHGNISGSATQNLEQYQQTSTVIAEPASGYHFIQWSDGQISTSRQDTVLSDSSYTALFEPLAITVTYSAASNGSLSGPSPQLLLPGETGATVSAIPNPGYHFTQWSDGLTIAIRQDTLSASLSLTASFALNDSTIDSDHDGLSDADEVLIYGTHPDLPDTDHDGISDYWEIIAGSDPNDPDSRIEIDSDNDGLLDSEELALGTSPYDADSDDDTLTDYEEVLAGLDPLTANPIKSMTGLLAWYSFNEQQGLVALDHSGNGNHATVTASAFTTDANRACFSVTSADILVPAIVGETISNAITVAFWVKGDAGIWNTSIIDHRPDNTRVLNIHLPWNTTVYFDAGNILNGYDRVSTTIPSDHTTSWHHWAFTKNATTGDMKIYLNGAAVSAQTGKTTTMGELGELIFGMSYRGLIDELAIFNRAITDSEVQALAGRYALWSREYQLTGSKLDDDDGDSLSNLIEYAFGLNPTQADATALLQINYNHAQNQLSLSFTPAHNHLTYTVQSSTDLAEWLDIPTSVGAEGALTTVEIDNSLPVRFLRIKVTE